MIAIVLWLFLQIAPPDFTATWDGNHTARLEWQQPANVALTCLYKQTTLIRCWRDLPPGATFTTLGGRGPLDAAARPRSGDTFTMVFDNEQRSARLGWVIWIGMVRR